MKNFTVKASVLAIAAALPGLANADINLNAGSGAFTYATELMPLEGATVTLPAINSPLGFGVSPQQDRYIRYKLTGAKWAQSLEDGSPLQVGAACDPAGASETVVQGGEEDSDVVIFQITADAPDGIAPGDSACLTLGQIKLDGAAEATIEYALYANPADAVAGGEAGRLKRYSGTIASFAPALDSVADSAPSVSTAEVSVAKYPSPTVDTLPYSQFQDGAGSVTKVTRIGSVSLDLNVDSSGETIKTLDGVDVELLDLVSEVRWIVSGEDFGSFDAIGAAVSCSDISVSEDFDPAINLDIDSVGDTSVSIETPVGALNAEICYIADGENPIAAQDFTVLASLTAAEGAILGSAGELIALGKFDRNGTVLKAPIMSGTRGQNTWIQVANMSSSDAPWSVQCYGPGGSLGEGASSVLGAGRTGKLFYNSLGCAPTANAVQIILDAPVGNVVGTLVRQSTTTGDSALDSLTGSE